VNAVYHKVTERPFSLREKARMRGYESGYLFLSYPLSPTLSLGEREIQWLN
jgi:hypothetical protein